MESLQLKHYNNSEHLPFSFTTGEGSIVLPNVGECCREIEREDRGIEQVGLRYRAVSAMGGDRGRAHIILKKGMINSLILGTVTPLYSKYAFIGALRYTAQMVSYEVSIGLIIIVRLVSEFGSAKAITRMFP